MTLKDCTKEELIFVVNQLSRHVGNYYVQRALIDVEEMREGRRIEEANRLLEIMVQKNREIAELYRPYDAQPYCDIPEDVVERANASLKELEEADRKWCRLMGIKVK